MIKLEDLSKIYTMGEAQIHALRQISLEITAGEMVAIMGPSGSGKTTLMNIVGLLDRPSQGNYYLLNQSISELSNNAAAILRNKTLGFVFQSFFLLPRLNALQNVALPLAYRNPACKDVNERALVCLEKLGVAELAKRKPDEMSGGQQQRVAIARALVGDPQIILADEPTGALDSKTGQQLMKVLLKLNSKEQRTVIIVTHDLNIAKQCRRVVNLQDGMIV